MVQLTHQCYSFYFNGVEKMAPSSNHIGITKGLPLWLSNSGMGQDYREQIGMEEEWITQAYLKSIKNSSLQWYLQSSLITK